MCNKKIRNFQLRIFFMKAKHLYLVFAFLGLVLTWYYNIQFYIISENTSILYFIKQTTTTLPAKSIAADISVVAVTFLVWMVYESLTLKIRYWWLIVLLTFLVALAFSFPLFLYLREIKREKISKIDS